jgi:drug/metabolite transporter (DMT)-like permease
VPSHAALPRLALLTATVVWGATFVVVQQALHDMPVFHLLSLRFALAALVLLPLLRASNLGALLRDGLETGFWLFVGFALQTLGLCWTTPSRSAFLTALSVVLVPAFAVVSGQSRLRRAHLLAVGCALTGLYLLSWPRAGETAAVNTGRGDLLTLGCAAAFAVYVVRNQIAVRRHRPAPLAIVQFVVIALLSAPSWVLTPASRAEFTTRAEVAVLVTSILGTALAFFCLLYAQQKLSVVTAAVILALEPVIAAAVSVASGAEPWTLALAGGGSLVLAAVLVVELGAPPEAPSPTVAHYP